MEWFRPGTEPDASCALHAGTTVAADPGEEIRIGKPSPGLHLALDPRIPDELERFALELKGLPPGARVEWWIDDAPFAESSQEDGRTLWPLSRGRHVAKARVFSPEASEATWTEPVAFRVK
jgi:penicillin-binding protein 1C